MRKSTVTSLFTVMLLTASLSACTGMTTKHVIGGDTGSTLGGAALGGLVGSQVR